MLVMVEKTEYKYPDDDGRRQRAWITDCDERGESACKRVLGVLKDRPWVRNVEETVKNSDEDKRGVDIYLEMDDRLMALLGIGREAYPIAVQVKSSEFEQRKFGQNHKRKVFNVKKNEHMFVLDGQDALDVLKADLVGQMLVLVTLTGRTGEKGLLRYLEEEMRDKEIVNRFLENKELLLEAKWYGPFILGEASI